MTRDVSLLRRLLLEAERGDALAPDVPSKALNEHVLLLQEAGYVEAAKPSSMETDRWTIRRLTWRGMEVLDAIRDEGFWAAMTARLASQAMPFEFLVSLGYQHITSQCTEGTD